jgi:uncharacterized membrane protein YphA (DoxX/SURF4 family)
VRVIELLAGRSLIPGFMTRTGAAATVFLSTALMPVFGWTVSFHA